MMVREAVFTDYFSLTLNPVSATGGKVTIQPELVPWSNGDWGKLGDKFSFTKPYPDNEEVCLVERRVAHCT